VSGSPLGRLDPQQIERFERDLGALLEPVVRIGLAVSGGPDSVALLLLAAAARPGRIEAATVDHALRPESGAEAAFVAQLCGELGIRHQTLVVDWPSKPVSAIQESARDRRYALLARWAQERGLGAILTAHHRDDQAETLLMRLQRGAGVTGLAGMRAVGRLPASDLPLIRPLLGWSRAELASVCDAARVSPVQDPSNRDEQFERVRVRKAMAEAPWLDASGIADSAAHLAQAQDALAWAADSEWARAEVRADAISYTPSDAPAEIRRRLAARAIAALASEGEANPLRGQEIDNVVAALDSGRSATLRGVLCTGGPEWRFTQAPKRRS
jgi:tRNA(Ile)-lysidine synthase